LPASITSTIQIPLALRPLFYRRSRFRLPPLQSLPRGTSLRPFESRDRASCLAIYQHNEHGYFPADFLIYFEVWLDSEEFLKLVLCIDDVPVAIGAVNCQKRFGLTTAWLTFRMVSPAYQGKGLGSALVLARLSLLPKPTQAARVLMTNVEASRAFYARFGFAPYGASPSGRSGLMLPCNSTLIGEREWQACRERVASLGLRLPTIEVPRRIARSLATARVTGLTQLVVLVELFGLIVLFTVERPYNWLGAIFILCGQYLQRLERRRLQKRGEAALRRRYGHSQIP
jgi:GNAT superfamily N-acetyltransferase